MPSRRDRLRRSAAAASRGPRLGASRAGWRLRQPQHRLQKRSRCAKLRRGSRTFAHVQVRPVPILSSIPDVRRTAWNMAHCRHLTSL